jgi:hypothetical protein
MNYLIIEGYQTAAVKFAEEAHLDPIDLESIDERIAIRNAIHQGDIQSAIERINDLCPEVGFKGLNTHAPLVGKPLTMQMINTMILSMFITNHSYSTQILLSTFPC